MICKHHNFNIYLVHVALLIAVLAFVGIDDSAATEFDLAAILLRQAEKSPAASKSIDERNAFCRELPFVGGHNCKKMGIGNIRVQSAGVRYSEVKPSPIPETITTESYIFRNCSSDQRRDSKTVSISYAEGYSVVTQDSIRSTNGSSATLTISGQQLGINASQEISFQESKTHQFSKTVNEAVTLDETIKPYTALIVKIEKRISNAYLDFSGDLIPNADIYSEPCCGWDGNSTFVGQFANLVGERKLTVHGQIWNAKAQATTKSYQEIVLNKENPVHCPPTDLPASVGAPGREALNAVAVLPLAATISPDKQVVPFINGMTIKTSDSVGTVEVRAKSLAAGFCGVEFQTFGGNAQFLAPPQLWSPWTHLASHIGSVNFTITNNVVCDVGIIAEVRYFK